MHGALAKASSLKPEIRLAQAVSEFEADLSNEQKSAFRTLKSQSFSTTPGPRDVMRLTAEFDRRISKKFSSQCFGPRFTNFLHGAQQFAVLGDVVVGGSQNLIACGVWSVVRMSLLVSDFFSVIATVDRSCTVVNHKPVGLYRQAILTVHGHRSLGTTIPGNVPTISSIHKATDISH
jgi:hypothetical protein